MQVRFLLDAEEELAAAVWFYEASLPGLGRDFLVEVRRTYGLIAENLTTGRRLSLQVNWLAWFDPESVLSMMVFVVMGITTALICRSTGRPRVCNAWHGLADNHLKLSPRIYLIKT